MATPTDSARPRADLGMRHLMACAVRGLAAAGAVVLLAAGIGFVVWAVTPEAGDVGPVLQGAMAALGAANYLPPSIGGIAVTIAPLLLTAVCFGVVASAADRGRGAGVGVGAEWVGGLVVGVVYGAVVAAVVAVLAPAGSPTERLWAPVLLGVAAAGTGIAVRAPGWRRWWRDRAPVALRVGVRAGGAVLLVLLVGGAVAVAAGLAASFGTAADLSSMAAPSVGEGTGMLLLSLAFLPNAVVAGTGYTLGAGFQIGAGTYSPLGTNAVELPALPLLAAVPDAGGTSWIGLILVIFPVLAAVLMGWYAVRHLAYRRDRLAAVAVAAVLAAGLLAVLAAVSGGGVQGSDWATLMIPALGLAGVAFAGLLLLAGAVAGTAGWGSTPWSAVAEAAAASRAAETSDDADPADVASGAADADADAVAADADADAAADADGTADAEDTDTAEADAAVAAGAAAEDTDTADADAVADADTADAEGTDTAASAFADDDAVDAEADGSADGAGDGPSDPAAVADAPDADPADDASDDAHPDAPHVYWRSSSAAGEIASANDEERQQTGEAPASGASENTDPPPDSQPDPEPDPPESGRSDAH